MSVYISPFEWLQNAEVLERPGRGQMVVRNAEMGRIAVDESCTGCQLCVKACPAKALEMDGPKMVRMVGDFAGCIGCGDCIAICPPDAITLTRPMSYSGLYKHIGRGDLQPPRKF